GRARRFARADRARPAGLRRESPCTMKNGTTIPFSAPSETKRLSPEVVLVGAASQRSGSMSKSFVRGTWQKSRAFSPAVITEGGKVIWIAGHTGQKDSDGNSLAGDFDAQMRQTFTNIEATLREAGASLKDIVTMTVFLADSRYTTRMTEIRTE